MNKLDMESKDLVQFNINKIKELFPSCIKEEKIDFDLLKQELSSDLIIDSKEKYQLTWPGKKEAIVSANSKINLTLRPDYENSIDYENTDNVYIMGDNLDALKILQESYLNKIKMIYIDPPYNTGKDFIYNDNFSKNNDTELEQSGQIDSLGNRLISNSSSNGRFHSDWLSMIYPRIKLARNLLTKDGIIFISIDDNEYSNLKKICDEIFGENNFVINFIWEKGKEGGNDSSIMRSHYENILCYCKDSSANGIINLDKKDTSRHITSLPEENLVDGIIENQRDGEMFQLINLSKQKDYTVKIPLKTGEVIEWPSYAPQKTIDNWIKIGKVFVGEKKVPYIKSYFADELQGQKPSNILDQKYGTTKSGSIEIRELFGSREIFSYPKPSSLIKRLLEIGSHEDSIILDFFSGSGTTAQAVSEINKEDNGKRKYILVQLPEICEDKSEAKKYGYNNICEIALDRIKKCTDTGVRVFKIDSSNMKNIFYKPSEVTQANLFDYMSNIKDDRTAEDLLTQVLLDLGLTLDLKIEEKNILNNHVYFVADNALVACFDQQVNIDIIENICKCNPLKVVFKDVSFKTDKDKINLEERIKKLSPDTEISIL